MKRSNRVYFCVVVVALLLYVVNIIPSLLSDPSEKVLGRELKEDSISALLAQQQQPDIWNGAKTLTSNPTNSSDDDWQSPIKKVLPGQPLAILPPWVELTGYADIPPRKPLQPLVDRSICCHVRNDPHHSYRQELQDLTFMERTIPGQPLTNTAFLLKQTTLKKERHFGSLDISGLDEESPCTSRSSTPSNGTLLEGDGPSRIVFCTYVPPQRNKLAIEWVMYHWLLGVKSFVIQDNDPDYPLSTSLKPFVQRGIVDVVNQFTARSSDFPLSPDPQSFHAACQRVVSKKDPGAIIGRLSVDDFLVITKKSSRRDKGNQLREFACVDEVLAHPATGGARKLPVTVIPSVSVGHGDHWFDNHRTPFERASFATGPTKTILATLDLLHHGVDSSSGRVLHPYQFRVFGQAGGDVGGGLYFASGEQVGNPQVNLTLVALTARVVSFARPWASSILDAVEDCWCPLPGKSPSQQQQASAASQPRMGRGVFDLGGITQQWKRNVDLIDELPDAHSAKSTGLIALHKLMLRGLGFGHDRRSRNFFDDTPIAGKREYGAMLAVLDLPKGHQLVAQNEITNGKVVNGELKLKKEALLSPLNIKKVREVVADGSCHRGRSSLNVTFCAVVRNRAKLTVEWVLYHLILGVQRFVIFDDGSTDGIADDMKPLIDEGLVDLRPTEKDGPFRFKQRPVKGPLLHSYGQCLMIEEQRAAQERHETAPWVALVDSDEFFLLKADECISQLVERVVGMPSSTVGAIAVPWREVGHWENDFFDKYRTQFDRTAFSIGHYDKFQRVKNIVRADLGIGMLTAHRVDLRPPYETYFADGSVMQSAGWFTGLHEGHPAQASAQLLHYHARSYSSWLQRHLDGFADDNDKIWRFDLSTLLHRWWGSATAFEHERNVALFKAIGSHQWSRYQQLVELLGGLSAEATGRYIPPTQPIHQLILANE